MAKSKRKHKRGKARQERRFFLKGLIQLLWGWNTPSEARKALRARRN